MESLANIVRGGLNVCLNKFTGSRIPFEISIHIIDSCNLECSYCYSNFYKRGNPWISETQIFKIVDGFRKLGAIECSLIGGEPLLHPKFSQLVDYITDKGMTCSAPAFCNATAFSMISFWFSASILFRATTSFFVDLPEIENNSANKFFD